MDEGGSVVRRHDAHARRKPLGQHGELRFHAVDHIEGVFPVTHDDDAADRLAPAIDLRDSEPDVRSDRHRCDVAYPDRYALDANTDGQVGDVADAAQVAEPANHVVATRDLDGPPADIRVRAADSPDYLVSGHPEAEQGGRVQKDLVLLDEPPDAGNLADSPDLLELVPEVPVLDGAKPVERVAFPFQRVLVDPPHARRVGTELGLDALGELGRRRVQVLQHPTPGPIEIRALLEQDVDKRETEHRLAAHRRSPRDG